MQLTIYLPEPSQALVPYFPQPIPAGPAREIEQHSELINILSYLKQGRDDVVFLRAYGDSMRDVGINDGDMIVCHRSEAAKAGEVVVAEINGEYTVKRLKEHSHGLYLVPANDMYPIRRVNRSDTFRVFAIVMSVIHKMQRVF